MYKVFWTASFDSFPFKHRIFSGTLKPQQRHMYCTLWVCTFCEKAFVTTTCDELLWFAQTLRPSETSQHHRVLLLHKSLHKLAGARVCFTLGNGSGVSEVIRDLVHDDSKVTWPKGTQALWRTSPWDSFDHWSLTVERGALEWSIRLLDDHDVHGTSQMRSYEVHSLEESTPTVHHATLRSSLHGLCDISLRVKKGCRLSVLIQESTCLMARQDLERRMSLRCKGM